MGGEKNNKLLGISEEFGFVTIFPPVEVSFRIKRILVYCIRSHLYTRIDKSTTDINKVTRIKTGRTIPLFSFDS